MTNYLNDDFYDYDINDEGYQKYNDNHYKKKYS